MKRIKFSNFSFYVFTICLIVTASLVLAVTISSLLSGHQLPPHAQFRVWMTVFAFLAVAALALIRILMDIITWLAGTCRKFTGNRREIQEDNTDNTRNTDNIN